MLILKLIIKLIIRQQIWKKLLKLIRIKLKIYIINLIYYIEIDYIYNKKDKLKIIKIFVHLNQ